jgi:hypothetical protein
MSLPFREGIYDPPDQIKVAITRRDALVVFTGVSGSGKSSLAFGTLYAEAQRSYLESVSPYARRLFHQMAVPEVESVEGLPPAVALHVAGNDALELRAGLRVVGDHLTGEVSPSDAFLLRDL